MKDLKKELRENMIELDFIQKQWCTKEEEKEIKMLRKEKKDLPEGIIQDTDDSHFRWVESNLSNDEINHLLKLRQTLYLRTIKSCMIFFVVLAAISLICTLRLLNRS